MRRFLYSTVPRRSTRYAKSFPQSASDSSQAITGCPDAVTASVMFALAWGKRVTGRQLGNPVLTKEAGVTIVDGLLAVAVLIGLLLNATVGWWWADPLASLVIVGYGLREGWTAWQESRPAPASAVAPDAELVAW